MFIRLLTEMLKVRILSGEQTLFSGSELRNILMVFGLPRENIECADYSIDEDPGKRTAAVVPAVYLINRDETKHSARDISSVHRSGHLRSCKKLLYLFQRDGCSSPVLDALEFEALVIVKPEREPDGISAHHK